MFVTSKNNYHSIHCLMLPFLLNTFLMEYRSIKNKREINEVYKNDNDSSTNVFFNTERCTVSTALSNWYKVELHFIALNNNNVVKRYKFNTTINDLDKTSSITVVSKSDFKNTKIGRKKLILIISSVEVSSKPERLAY